MDVDNTGATIGPVRYAAPNADVLDLQGGDISPAANSGVTFCARFQELSATLQGALDLSDAGCFDADPATACTITEEEIELILNTLQAHAFNFLLVNQSNSIKRVTVEARATSTVSLSGSGNGSAKAVAIIGLGSMLVEKVRLVKNATGEPALQVITDLK